jgi:DNA-binding beta-propeller fold protein YncE
MNTLIGSAFAIFVSSIFLASASLSQQILVGDANNLTILDLSNAGGAAQIHGVSGAYKIAVTPDHQFAYAVLPSQAKVIAIDLTTEKIADVEIANGALPFRHPTGIAISRDGRNAYVVDYELSQIIPIDLATNRTLPPMGGVTHPFDIAIAPNGRAYVTDNGASAVVPIDLEKRLLFAPIPLPVNKEQLALTTN